MDNNYHTFFDAFTKTSQLPGTNSKNLPTGRQAFSVIKIPVFSFQLKEKKLKHLRRVKDTTQQKNLIDCSSELRYL
jgi:hypothetical protein